MDRETLEHLKRYASAVDVELANLSERVNNAMQLFVTLTPVLTAFEARLNAQQKAIEVIGDVLKSALRPDGGPGTRQVSITLAPLMPIEWSFSCAAVPFVTLDGRGTICCGGSIHS